LIVKDIYDQKIIPLEKDENRMFDGYCCLHLFSSGERMESAEVKYCNTQRKSRPLGLATRNKVTSVGKNF